jgi:magnesium transporter
MFISVNPSGIAGTVIPMLSKRLGFDPALTAGPFETAFQDVLGVTIFLSLATNGPTVTSSRHTGTSCRQLEGI